MTPPVHQWTAWATLKSWTLISSWWVMLLSVEMWTHWLRWAKMLVAKSCTDAPIQSNSTCPTACVPVSGGPGMEHFHLWKWCLVMFWSAECRRAARQRGSASLSSWRRSWDWRRPSWCCWRNSDRARYKRTPSRRYVRLVTLPGSHKLSQRRFFFSALRSFQLLRSSSSYPRNDSQQ